MISRSRAQATSLSGAGARRRASGVAFKRMRDLAASGASITSESGLVTDRCRRRSR